MTDAQARADAHRAVTAVLVGRLAPTLSADPVAEAILDALHGLGWRHVPRPQPITAQGRQGDYDQGLAQTRKAMQDARDRKAAKQAMTKENPVNDHADYECTLCGGSGWVNGRMCTGTAHSTR